MSVLREVFRHRERSVFTIFGVAIGVFILVVVGAIAEKARIQVEEAHEYSTGVVTVADEGAHVNAFSREAGLRPLTADTLDALRRAPGVKEVHPCVALLLDPGAVPIGTPATIVGGDDPDRLAQHAHLTAGRIAAPDERGVVVLGVDLVDRLDARLGGTVELLGHQFEVVGILDRTYMAAIDQAATIALDDARMLLRKGLPDDYARDVDFSTLALTASVVAEDGVDADRLAEVIENEVAGVMAVGPTELRLESGRTLALLNALVVAIGLIALIGGGLVVVNTMVVVATEGTHEVGIKRALGASPGRIVQDMLVHSLVIGALGGVLGVALGSVATVVIGRIAAAGTGMGVFAVTPRLLIGAVVYSMALGVMAGVYPARYAARLDPVDALAAE